MMKKSLLLACLLCLLGTVVALAQSPAGAFTTTQRTVTQDFNSMWDAQAGEALLAMPTGWRVDRNLTAPRTVGEFATAQTELMYSGGENLASNAKNGTWNWGASSDPADRAVGGLTTSVSGGTRALSVMALLHNDADEALTKLALSYDVEKYRYGSNAAGFDVQLYTSADGVNWTSAGDDFKTHFDPDASTIGADVVPIASVNVQKTLKVNVEAGADLYLAWNITVASGSNAASAPGLALDNVSITAATFASEEMVATIYVEDVTGWKSLVMLYDDEQLEPVGTTAVNGVSYKYFEVPEDLYEHSVRFTNGTAIVGDLNIVAEGEHYYCLTATELTEIDDPENYTGWVDPTRPPFKASGIYLRGEVNSWGADSEWEFSDEGDGTYVLYDKTLSGTFKVADASWSSACNYGSNGAMIFMDQPYALVAGTNDNISTGGNSYVTKRIVLSIVNGNATLLLEGNDDESDLTSVYMIGDLNSWNYMDKSGELKLTDTDGVFEGQVTLPAGDAGLSHWRIYQRLGMGGVWGAQGGQDATGDNRTGTLEKGSNGMMTTAPGTYKCSFNIATGEFALEQMGSVPTTMTLEPAAAVLVPTLPEQVKVLSLNNSLIHYNDQDAVFNAIAQAMGKNATWKKHSLLGKSLNAHWEEGDGLAGDGTPGAKMLVRSEAWSHIILQEQSSLPRTNVESFRANVKKWVDYIREYCPNPNAVIIIPVNWAYSGDWTNFTEYNRTFMANYRAVAREMGVTLCPVGLAYQNAYDQEGANGLNTWFQDDRHPTDKSTYMAACMEYALIFGEDATTITYAPSQVSADDAQAMRAYAAGALNGFENYVDHTAGVVRYKVSVYDQFGMEIEPADPVQLIVSGGGNVQGTTFTSDGTMGTYDVEASIGTFAQSGTLRVAQPVTQVVTYPAIELNEHALEAGENFDSMGTDAQAALPAAWRIDHPTTAPRTVGRWDEAQEATMYGGGVNLPNNAKNGTWNFGDNDGTDRAVGGISTGVSGGTRCVNVYAHLLNTGKKNIENVQLAYDVEKYRMGTNAEGFDVQLYYSIDGRNWTSAGDNFKTHFAPDAATAGYEQVPGDVVNVKATLPVNLQPGVDLYLAWNITVAAGTNAASAQALAIDNFSITGELPTIPAAKHYVYAEDNTGWDALGLYAWGDSELFGSWPGEAVAGDVTINGVTYKVFLLDTEGGNYHLIFNNWNNGSQLPDYDIVANRDYYFTLTATAATEVDPATYGKVPGDVDGNGLVNGSDVTTLYNFLLNGAAVGGNADVDGNGTINGSDVTALYNILLAQ